MVDMLSGGARGARTPAATPPSSAAHAAAGGARPATAQPPGRSAGDARPATAQAAPVPAGAILLSRTEVDAALGDFVQLTAAIRGVFSASGVVVDAVSDGSIFQRAGLRGGDVIMTVDGARLRSLDDAANIYARAAMAKVISTQILRTGKPMTLHIAIQ